MTDKEKIFDLEIKLKVAEDMLKKTQASAAIIDASERSGPWGLLMHRLTIFDMHGEKLAYATRVNLVEMYAEVLVTAVEPEHQIRRFALGNDEKPITKTVEISRVEIGPLKAEDDAR